MQGNVAEDDFFAEFEEFMRDRVIIAVILEVLLKHLFVVGLSRGNYHWILEDILCGDRSTYVMGSIMNS